MINLIIEKSFLMAKAMKLKTENDYLVKHTHTHTHTLLSHVIDKGKNNLIYKELLQKKHNTREKLAKTMNRNSQKDVYPYS